MAESTHPESGDQQAAQKRPGLMTIVKAGAFLSVIVLLQVAGASMLLPTGEETEAIAEKLAAADAAQDIQSEGSAITEDSIGTLALRGMREVPLGAYHVQTYNQDTGTSLNVDFELFGTVLEDEESEFFHLFSANEIRIREQVIVTVRSAEMTDLTDAGLGLIKRKILEKTNRALGKPLLHEAVFSSYTFIER